MAGQLDTISQLAQLLGGTRTTGTADTAALRQVLAQMQQQNSPEGQAAQLQALFQQAAGSIPGLQGAYANAVGARRGGNTAVQGALNKLLSQVTLAGQTQQNQNLNNQAQAAAALASATRGQSSSTNLGGVVRNLLLAQGLAEGNKAIKGAGGLGGIVSSALGNMTPTTAASPGLGNTEITQGSGMDMNVVPGVSGLDLTGSGDILNDGFSMDNIDLGFDAGASGLSADSGVDFGGGGLLDELESYGVFADGGLVGRDGQAPRGGDEEMAEERAQARFDPGFTENVALDILRNLMPAFADGGAVQLNASGARRSTAQSINPALPTPKAATNQTTQAPQAAPAAQAGISLSDVTGAGGMGPGPVNYQDNDLANGIRAVAANPVARFVANLALPGIGPIMGIAGLPADVTKEQALGAFARPALGMVASEAIGGMTPAQSVIANTVLNSITGGDTGNFNTGTTGGRNGGTGPGYGSSSAPDGGASGSLSMGNVLGTGGFSSPSSGGFRFANGGEVAGPGTGTSDSIQAKLSDGEYVIPADVVETLGVEFFDMLRDALHTPAAVQRAQ